MNVTVKRIYVRRSWSFYLNGFCSFANCDKYVVSCKSAKSVARLASAIADISQVGDVVLLTGNLGSGKTYFARSFIRKLVNDPNMIITSPSYLLDNTYKCKAKDCQIHHMDLYRLPIGTDMSLLGIPDIFFSCICLIEWPDRLLPAGLPSSKVGTSSPFASCLEVELETTTSKYSRQLVLKAHGSYKERIKHISFEGTCDVKSDLT